MSDKKMSELFAQDRYGDVVPLPRPRPPPGREFQFSQYDRAQRLAPPPSAMAVEAGYSDIDPHKPYGLPVPGFKPDPEGGFQQDMASLREIAAMADPDVFYKHIMTRPESANLDYRRRR